MMKYYVLLFHILIVLSMEAQAEKGGDNVFHISKFKLGGVESKIELYNQLELLTNIEEKTTFLNNYEFVAKKENNTSHLLFVQFLKGEVFFGIENLKESFTNYHKLLSLSKTEKDVDNEFLAYTSLMHYHYKTQKEDSIKLYMAKAKEFIGRTDNSYYKAIYLRRQAEYYIKKEDYQSALTQLLQISKIELTRETSIHCNALTNIGWIYEHLSYPERAKIYYLKAFNVAKKIEAKRFFNFCKLKLAHIELFNLNNPHKALEEYKQLEEEYKNSNKYQEGVLYGTMGYAYVLTNKQEEALHYLKKSQNFFEKTGDSIYLCLPYTYFTHYYNKYEQYENAIQSGETALKIIENKNLFKARKLILLDKLAESYMAIGDKDKAYDLLKELNDIKTTLETKKNNIAFIESQQENKENQEKLQIVELKNQILNKNRTQYIFSLFLVGAILILTLFFYRNRQKTNIKLREIDALKTNFFTNISHEFRTPLTLISSPIQETLEELDLSNEKRKHFEIAQRNTKRLSSLVDQLLELSKIDSGNRKLLLQKNSPTQMIAAWCESFLYLAEQKNINFKTDIQNKEVKVWFDREALENIIVNLLGNAIKYTPEKGEILLQVSIENNFLRIKVRNSGQGLENKQIKTIFNRFYQTDGQNEGAGIGLSLVKELTELHGGKVSVASEVNKWSLFEVSLCLDKEKLKNAEIRETIDPLPIVTPLDEETKELQEEITGQDNELPILLIVEDNADVRTLLTDTFKKEYEVVQAVNGEEGVLKALDIIPDIIISDLMMPIKDGIALTNTLKNDERTSHIPVILLTAKAGDENELTGIETGADDYITKPFNQKILKSKTASLVALRKKLQSRYSQEVILKPKDIAITSVDEKFLERVQTILDEKLKTSTFTIEDFSKTMNMSRMQLHRKLKALTGLSASEFVKSQRLKLAVQILTNSDINISEVGYTAGFNDHAYFSKCFKEAYNCTPSEFLAAKKST